MTTTMMMKHEWIYRRYRYRYWHRHDDGHDGGAGYRLIAHDRSDPNRHPMMKMTKPNSARSRNAGENEQSQAQVE